MNIAAEPNLPDALIRGGRVRASPGPLTRNTLALILAGGRGSRLAELTNWRAKPSVPFGGKFQIIDFALSNCVNSGIRRIGICTQYKAQSLIRHLQRGWSFLDGRFGEFVELLPAQQRIEATWYQGTARRRLPEPRPPSAPRSAYVLVLAGDHVYKMDYGRMLEDHVDARAPTDRRVRRRAARRCEVARRDGGGRRRGESCTSRKSRRSRRPCRIAPTGRSPAWASTCSTPPSSTTRSLRDADDPYSSHDFGKDIIPGLLAAGRARPRPRLRGELRQHEQRRTVLAGHRHDRCVLGSERRADPRRARVESLRPRVADLDAPGAVAAGEIRVRRRR